MKIAIGARNDGRARFLFEVIELSTGQKSTIEKNGTSRLDAFNALTKEKGNSLEIKWA